MRRHFSIAIMLFGITVILVGAHLPTVKENDSGKIAVVKAAVNSHFDVVFINNAIVPVVQPNFNGHIASVSFIAGGYAPMAERKARAPTMDKTNLSPLPRDKPNGI